MSFGMVLPFLPFRLLTLCSAPSPVSFAQLSADLGVLILRRRHDCPTVCRSTPHEDRRVDRPSHTSDASRQDPPARGTTGAAAPQRYSPPGPSRTRRRARRSSRLLPPCLRCLARGAHNDFHFLRPSTSELERSVVEVGWTVTMPPSVNAISGT